MSISTAIDPVATIDDALSKDSHWKVVIPITSTHFQSYNDGNDIAPNYTGQASNMNLLDMFNSSILNNNSILCHMENLQYPSTRGSKALLELEEFSGCDSEDAMKIVETTIKDRARLRSTVLTSSRGTRQ